MVAFYRALGFEVLRDDDNFVEPRGRTPSLLADVSAIDVAEPVELPDAPRFPVANVQVMVPDVDDRWRVANEIGARVVVAIGDRYYGLRDFMIADPDGFGVRFATRSEGG